MRTDKGAPYFSTEQFTYTRAFLSNVISGSKIDDYTVAFENDFVELLFPYTFSHVLMIHTVLVIGAIDRGERRTIERLGQSFLRRSLRVPWRASGYDLQEPTRLVSVGTPTRARGADPVRCSTCARMVEHTENSTPSHPVGRNGVLHFSRGCPVESRS